MIRSFTDAFCSYYEYICRKACRKRSPCRRAPCTVKRSRQVIHYDHSKSVCPSTSPQHPAVVDAYHTTAPHPASPPTIPPPRVFPISPQTIDEKSLPTMQSTDITMFGRPLMLLYFLAANPEFMLPLAPMRPIFGEMATYIPQASASPTTGGFPGLYFDYLRIVTNNRLRYSIDKLFPHLTIMHLLHTKGYYDIPELERGPVPILEYIVRDAMALCNPIDYIVTFLEQVVSNYRTLTTDDDRHAYRARILERAPLQDMYMLTHLYGQYVWDSRWAPDATLHQLVQLFETVTTEVFPNAFEIVSKGNIEDLRSQLPLNMFISNIIIGIAPCFLHHYRPIRNPIHFCMPHGSSHSDYSYPIPVDQFPALMESLKSDVMQCTSDYLEHPELFSTPPPLPLHLASPLDGSSSEAMMVHIQSPTSTCLKTQTQAWPQPQLQSQSQSQPQETTLITNDTTTATTTTTTTTTTKRVIPHVLLTPFTQCSKDSDGGTGTHDSICNSDDVKRYIDQRLYGMVLMLTTADNVEDNQYQLPFRDFRVSRYDISHLVRFITRCPPKDDPVYMALSPIFEQLTPEVLRVMMIPSPFDPGLSCPCSNPHTHTRSDYYR